MLNIGCHLSSAKGYLHMGEEALALGANTFSFLHVITRRQSQSDRYRGYQGFTGADAGEILLHATPGTCALYTQCLFGRF